STCASTGAQASGNVTPGRRTSGSPPTMRARSGSPRVLPITRDRIAVVDDVVDDEVDRIVGAVALAPRARPQAFRPDHEIDVAGRERRLLGDPHRTDARELHPSRTRWIDASGQEVAVADEFSDEAVGRPVVDVERRSDLFDLAVAEHGDAIGH